MEEYRSNSHRSKIEQAAKENSSEVTPRKNKRVIEGTHVKKKSWFESFAGEIFLGEARDIKENVMKGIIIPSIKDAIMNTINDAVSMALYGERSTPNRRSSGSNNWTSYRTSNTRDDRFRDSRNEPKKPRYYDIVIDSRAQAEDALDQMKELVDMYKVVSVSDLNEILGISGEFTDSRYGWTEESLRYAEIIHVRDGFVIKLPREKPIS